MQYFEKLVFNKKIFTSTIAPFLYFLLLPHTAFALGGDTPVGEGLQYIIDAMYGGTGIALATISIIAVGLACLTHHLEWKYLVITVAGVAIIFGAGAIVSGIRMLVHSY